MNHSPLAPLSRRAGGSFLLVALLLAASGCSSDSGGGTGVTADYRISLSPSHVTLAGGGSAATTITIDRTDFTGEVALSLTGTASGVTGFIDPVTTTGTTATLTVLAGPGAPAGDVGLIVRGSADIGDRAQPLAITVTQAPPSFSLEVAPSQLTIMPGDSAGSGVIITRTNFTGPVALVMTGEPAGVTWSFEPAVSLGLGSTLTVHVGPATASGVYDLSVLGTGTPGTESALLTLTVP